MAALVAPSLLFLLFLHTASGAGGRRRVGGAHAASDGHRRAVAATGVSFATALPPLAVGHRPTRPDPGSASTAPPPGGPRTKTTAAPAPPQRTTTTSQPPEPATVATSPPVVNTPPAALSQPVVGSAGSLQGTATWYGQAAPGTCASPTLAFGTVVEVVNVADGAEVSCVVDDREGTTVGRVLDLSYAGFSALASPAQGVATVTVSWGG